MIVNKNHSMNKLMSHITKVDFEFILEKEFYKYKDCLILDHKKINDFDSLSQNWNNDMTSIEAHFNDFTIEQCFDEKIIDPRKRFEQAAIGGLVQKAIGVCKKLFDTVKKSEIIVQEDKLRIIVTLDAYNSEIDENLELLDSACGKVKLIKIRDNDGWLDKNIEVYKQPVMTVDFDKLSIKTIPENWW